VQCGCERYRQISRIGAACRIRGNRHVQGFYEVRTIITLQKDSEHQVRVYWHRRYGNVSNDEDIETVNNGQTSLLFPLLGVTEKNTYNIVLRNVW
jgi:hypothetical protein